MPQVSLVLSLLLKELRLQHLLRFAWRRLRLFAARQRNVPGRLTAE